jgi:hypothetical protein
VEDNCREEDNRRVGSRHHSVERSFPAEWDNYPAEGSCWAEDRHPAEWDKRRAQRGSCLDEGDRQVEGNRMKASAAR